MSVSIVVDMNLSPEWIDFFERAGKIAAHWSSVGDPRALDSTIMAWAEMHRFVVLTHDLDFGTALALTHARGPSVLQIRTQNVMPEQIGPLVVSVLDRFETELAAGALIIVEQTRNRVRILPL